MIIQETVLKMTILWPRHVMTGTYSVTMFRHSVLLSLCHSLSDHYQFYFGPMILERVTPLERMPRWKLRNCRFLLSDFWRDAYINDDIPHVGYLLKNKGWVHLTSKIKQMFAFLILAACGVASFHSEFCL